MYLYKVVEGKSEFKARAESLRAKGFLARVVPTAEGHALYTDARAIRALGGTLKGRDKRKFQ